MSKVVPIKAQPSKESRQVHEEAFSAKAALLHEAWVMARAAWHAFLVLTEVCIGLAFAAAGYAIVCDVLHVGGGVLGVLGRVLGLLEDERAVPFASVVYTLTITWSYFRLKISGEDL